MTPGHTPENYLDWLENVEISNAEASALTEHEDHLDWLRPSLNESSKHRETLTLRRWHYDIPRFAGTRKPPSAFSATNEVETASLYAMAFWPLYKRYQWCKDDHEMASRRHRNRWNTPEQTEECLQRVADYKRQLELFEHMLRTLHFLQWMQQIQQEEMYLRQERERRLSRSRDYGMER